MTRSQQHELIHETYKVIGQWFGELDFDGRPLINDLMNVSKQIAEKEAMAFSEWCRENYVKDIRYKDLNGNHCWRWPLNHPESHDSKTTAQLYQLFLQQTPDNG